MNAKIQNKLKLLPKTPGVYIMRDASGEVIYVGKAISLKNRVSQYFVGFDRHLRKVQAMIVHIDDFDYILCKSEMEALILESNLIKSYMPKYNILLKDDKHYPYLRIDYHQAYPRIEVVRKVRRDGAKYYGPYLNATNIRKLLDYVYEFYPLRTCKKDLSKKIDDRPCLNYQIGRCLGPCALDVPEEAYRKNLDQVVAFLQGKTKAVKDALKAKMKSYADQLDFERAAELKEVLELIDGVIQDQSATVSRLDNRDMIGIATADTVAIVHLLTMREGKIVGSSHFKLEIGQDEEKTDILTAFLMQYYDVPEKIPREILLPADFADRPLIEEHLRTMKPTELLVPQRGEKRQMVLMAIRNANENIVKLKSNRQWKKTKGAAAELAKYLDIPGEIRRMECFDISHIQGTDTVASMTVFMDGAPAKKEYRRFKVRSVDGPDDFQSMREVLTRRFTRALNEQQSGEEGKFADLPDLLVIDGGKGQLGIAYEVLTNLHLTAIPVIGLAKRLEEVYIPGKSDPVVIPKNCDAQYLLERIRDEAHRFAITFHRALRDKRNRRSQLEDIPGVGKVRARELLRHFKSMTAVKEADVETLLAADKMDRRTAEAIYRHFHQEETNEK